VERARVYVIHPFLVDEWRSIDARPSANGLRESIESEWFRPAEAERRVVGGLAGPATRELLKDLVALGWRRDRPANLGK
jgi:hypothetical protein